MPYPYPYNKIKVPFPAYPILCSSFDVRVVHIEYDCGLLALYAQQHNKIIELEKFQGHLNKLYNDTSSVLDIEPLRIGAGLICVALSSTGNYYRGRVLTRLDSNSTPKTLKIRFFDYGHVAHVPLENVKILEVDHTFQPAFANKFYLPVRILKSLEENLVNEIEKATIKGNIRYLTRINIVDYHLDYWVADLYLPDDNTNLSEYLLKKNLITCASYDSIQVHTALDTIHFNE